MPSKSANQIRQEFFDFFAEKDHAIVPSAPVVPQNDPTLLFTNAGMNQFKAQFLGEEEALSFQGKTWKRAADTQKCIRVSGKHNDLEEVGYDTYHHTLFEMLGNWSFGDYFKAEAIEWAWELLVDRWGLEPARLYVTVFGGADDDGLPPDEEAVQLWREKTAISPDHILHFGKKDNFWEMGETGPCGPCSEIHIDLRSSEERQKVDGASLVNADDPRVMEIWNLVFIQFNRQNDGALKSLPAKHVDTGMGFERICAVMQGKHSNYDTDVFAPLINHICTLANIIYGDDAHKDIAVRVIADHVRAVSFSIADGASPGNEGRGYVVRRILRRAIRYGWDRLNIKKPFMFHLVDTLADQFAEVFPELKGNVDYVKNVVQAEEKSFLRTLGQGIALFEKMAEGKKEISGADAFKLHDTYGFPIDLTGLMARERGLQVDEKEFEVLMKRQKERARSAGTFKVDHSEAQGWTFIEEDRPTEFVGYDYDHAQTHIIGYKTGDGKNKAALLLEKTPFYAESGGQVADTGLLSVKGDTLRVLDVQKDQGRWVHYVDKLPQNLNAEILAQIDTEKRNESAKHHSATHLVHAALRHVLGEHVAQKGSLVNDQHLRFDFSHFEALTPKQLEQVERIVNERIQENIPLLEERNVPIEEAKNRGAMMLFGEKYGDFVRVITFDPTFSVELCGGTHVPATGHLGYFQFKNESSVAAGVRRIEAVVGREVDRNIRNQKILLEQLTALIGQSKNPVQDLQDLLEEKRQTEKEIERIRLAAARNQFQGLQQAARSEDGINFVVGSIENADMNQLKQLGYEALQTQPTNTITVLGSADKANEKVYLVATVTDDILKNTQIKAGKLVGILAKKLGGGGGGQPNLATAGGRKPDLLDQVLQHVPAEVANLK